MNPAVLFSLGHALHAMHAALVLEMAVDLVPADQRDLFFQSAYRGFTDGSDFDAPALRLSVTAVHPENFGREQRSFVASGTGSDLYYYVFFVERIFGQ